MNIVITGGTGFVGSHLTHHLTSKGHHVYVLTRNPEQHSDTSQVTHVGWLRDEYDPVRHLPSISAIINLAGASLNSGRWTEERKQTILQSRIQATEAVLNLIDELNGQPDVLINASAIGFYGNSKRKVYTEKTTKPGNGFLADVVTKWEQLASQAARKGVRTVYVRFGIILGEKGALPKMTIPYKLMTGGNLGSGEQWMSWIHIDDVKGLIDFAINNNKLDGPINGTAPYPHRNKEFGKTLAEVISRPHWLTVPSFTIKGALGEMSTLLLDGQAVLPHKATTNNYLFKYPKLKPALQSILNK